MDECDQRGAHEKGVCFLIGDYLNAGQRDFKCDFVLNSAFLRPKLHGRDLVGKLHGGRLRVHRIQGQQFEGLKRLSIQIGHGVVALAGLQGSFWAAYLDVDLAEVAVIVGRGWRVRKFVMVTHVLHHALHGQ